MQVWGKLCCVLSTTLLATSPELLHGIHVIPPISSIHFLPYLQLKVGIHTPEEGRHSNPLGLWQMYAERINFGGPCKSTFETDTVKRGGKKYAKSCCKPSDSHYRILKPENIPIHWQTYSIQRELKSHPDSAAVAMSWYSSAWCALLNPFAIASSWKTAHLPSSEVTIEQSEKEYSTTKIPCTNFLNASRIERTLGVCFGLLWYKTQVVVCSTGHNNGSVGACSFGGPVSLLHEALHSHN